MSTSRISQSIMEQAIRNHRVVIFGKSYCQESNHAKAVLKSCLSQPSLIELANKNFNIDLTAFNKSPGPTTTTTNSALIGGHAIEKDTIKIIDLDLMYRGTQLQRELFSTTKDKNLPKVFVDGKYIPNVDLTLNIEIN
jgi:hypothetical protein